MPEGVLFQIGNLKFGPKQILLCAGMAAFLIVVFMLSRMYWKRRLTKWAESQHVLGNHGGQPLTRVDWESADY